MSNSKLMAPFTPDQVDALNHYQRAGEFHPFTCRNRNDGRHNVRHGDRGVLRATEAGWVCDDCEYTQNWAHDFMVESVATDHRRRSTVRLGHHIRTSCACGWTFEERDAPSGDEADTMAWDAFDAHLADVNPTACPECAGSGTVPSEGYATSAGVGAISEPRQCPRCHGSGER